MDLGKTPEINVNPTSAQCQTDGRRAGLKIRSPQEGVGSSPTFGTIDLRRIGRRSERPDLVRIW